MRGGGAVIAEEDSALSVAAAASDVRRVRRVITDKCIPKPESGKIDSSRFRYPHRTRSRKSESEPAR